MTRVTLLDALVIYNLERGMNPEGADLEARRLLAWVQELNQGRGSADIYLHDFYFVAIKEDDEFYIDRSYLDGALENLRAGSGEA